jgi:cobalt/nickel transport system ATP-binding protein
MDSILEAKDVTFSYGPGKWAIREMNFVLKSPRKVALLGANGVGKSTLMLLLNGTLRPQEGELIVLGRAMDYSRSSLHWLHRKVGIVLQDPDDQLFGATVEQDVAFGPLNNGLGSAEARDLVMRTLDSLRVSHLADRPIHQLSLGEKKRVALAGVLIQEPEIILLDEPTAGLDFVGITSMLELLGRLHQAGTTIVVSTHDTDLAYEWAEDAWVLMDGHIAAQGPIVEVMQDPEMLQAAHLRIPWLLEMGLAIQEAHPDIARGPLPRTRDQMIARIFNRPLPEDVEEISVRSSGDASAAEEG